MSEKKKSVYLLDGSAIFYRAYFAFIRNPLINTKGENTSATFGFLNSIFKLLREENPDYIAVAFDNKAPTFRHEIYSEYKSTRAKMPDDLVVQLPRIQQAVKALNIPAFDLAGYEADDIIGTLAKAAEKQGYAVWCVTGDKDYFQLVSDSVRVYDPKKVSESADTYGPAEVKVKFGVFPHQVIDKLALMGDSSDCIPGVPGVGPKTADSLLEQFGSLDNLLAHTDEIKAKGIREKIENNVESAKLSKVLATIDTNVPIEFDVLKLQRQPINYEEAKKLFIEMEFTTFARQLTPESDTVEHKPLVRSIETGTFYHCVPSLDDLSTLLKSMSKQKEIAVDTETTSLDALDAELVGVSLSDRTGTAYYVPLGHTAEPERNLSKDEALKLLKELLENRSVQKIGQNIKYDFHIFRRHGITINPISFDTMLASYVLDPSGRQHSLDLLALKHFDHKMIPIADLIGSGKNQRTFDTVSVDKATAYAAEDADYTYRLRGVFAPAIDELDLQNLFYNIELPLVTVLADMEECGVKIDTDFLLILSEQMEKGLRKLEIEIHQIAGGAFNINSTQQLGHILFDKLGLPTHGKTAKKTGYSTDVSVLEELALVHPFPKLILEYRQFVKLKNTYVDAIPKLISPKTGRVHTSFNQTIAATGRLSSTDPNLQNIPIRTEEGRQIRKAFIPRDKDYLLLTADYSQIELRVLAHYADDPVLIEAFIKGEDIHVRTAAEVFNVDLMAVTPDMRRVAKTANFAIIYGVSAFGLSNQTDMTQAEAKKFIETYFERYPGIKGYLEATKVFAREKGYVCTLFNRRRYLPEINDKNFSVRQFAERTAINTPIQGTAADIIKIAMLLIHKKIAGMRSKMILQVHDELIFDAHKDEIEDLKKIVTISMQGAAKLKVPLVADIGIGPNWLEAK
ncbi:MAG: DNA polymerase I [candidate division Zixibacteria bacterium]|nr:DNA polymerase I [candidate division Zixibacteria bacterium]